MNKKYALVIVTALLLSGSEWCYGQNVASGEYSSPGKMQEQTKTDIAQEKVQRSKESEVVSPSKNESEDISKSYMQMNPRSHNSDDVAPEAYKIESRQDLYEADTDVDKKLPKTEVVRTMNDVDKIENMEDSKNDGRDNHEKKPKLQD